MAADSTCPKALAQGQIETVVVEFPKSLRTHCGELWTACGQSRLSRGLRTLANGCRIFGRVVAFAIASLVAFAFLTMAYIWIPIHVLENCHREPELAMTNFTIRDIAPVTTTPDSPWQVKSEFNASFSTWNKNTVTKCFTTYRRMDVRVEYKGQVILQQQIPLEFSLKPQRRRPFSIEMKSDHGQLTKGLGAYMQAELQSGNITLNFFFNTRYLIADRRSKWKRDGCVVVASSRLKTVLTQDCYNSF